MNKTTTSIGIVVILILLVAFFFGRSFFNQEEVVEDQQETVAEQAAQGTLPEIDTGANPLDDLAEVNPVEQVNPFSGGYKNPFSSE